MRFRHILLYAPAVQIQGSSMRPNRMKAAGEMLNEMQRERTGGVSYENESRYQVTFRRVAPADLIIRSKRQRPATKGDLRPSQNGNAFLIKQGHRIFHFVRCVGVCRTQNRTPLSEHLTRTVEALNTYSRRTAQTGRLCYQQIIFRACSEPSPGQLAVGFSGSTDPAMRLVGYLRQDQQIIPPAQQPRNPMQA